MVILGLGTNVENRLNHLQLALDAIKILPDLIIQQISPIYHSDALLPENAPADLCHSRAGGNPFQTLFRVHIRDGFLPARE